MMTPIKHKPIAITPGEPAGVGPDLVLKLMQHALVAPVVLVADRALLMERAAYLKYDVTLPGYSPDAVVHPPVSLCSVPLAGQCLPGVSDVRHANYVIETLKRATAGCLRGEFSALVTGPVNKAVINAAGIPFSGHTELLAELTQAEKPVMLLANEQLKVAVVTTHLPLSHVPSALSQALLKQCLTILHHDLKTKWRIDHPRILVCGLNPHAGEGGHLGHEDDTIIKPVIAWCQAQGMLVRGPCPADTAFTPAQRQTADVVLAMYHDQGLPVVKALGFGETVNVTLGLPIVRTSVDHGTAFELAGTGRASESSLLAALHLAHQLSTEEVQV